MFRFGSGSSSSSSASSGSGEINYISANPSAEFNVTGYLEYKDAAGVSPVDGTGGSPTILISRTTSTPLRGVGSFRITKDAVDRQGEGVSYDFTLDEADKNKLLKIEFDVRSSANYVAEDVKMFIYDITNTTLITPQANGVLKNDAGNYKHVSSWVSSSTSTSYRVIFHVATTSALAYTLDFDDLILGSGKIVTGAVDTYLGSIGGTLSGMSHSSFTNNSYRKGSRLKYSGIATANGAGSGNFELTLPTGYTIDTAKLGAGTNSFNEPVGQVVATDDSTSETLHGYVFANSSTVLNFTILTSGTTNDHNRAAAGFPWTWATNDVFSFTFDIPILEWENSGTVNLIQENNLTLPAAYTPTTNGLGTIANVDVSWTREGQHLYVEGRFDAGTVSASEARIGLPTGLTVATFAQDKHTVGHWTEGTATATSEKWGWLVANSGHTYVRFTKEGDYTSTQNPLTTINGNDGLTSSATFNIKFKVRIAEWANQPSPLVGFAMASSTYAGLVDIAAQTFAGVKTFINGTGGRTDGGTPTSNQVGYSTYDDNGNAATNSSASNTTQEIGQLTLNKGVWLLTGFVRWDNNGATVSARNMSIGFGTSAGTINLPASSPVINFSLSTVSNDPFSITAEPYTYVVTSDSTTVYMNSLSPTYTGGPMQFRARFSAVRIN